MRRSCRRSRKDCYSLVVICMLGGGRREVLGRLMIVGNGVACSTVEYCRCSCMVMMVLYHRVNNGNMYIFCKLEEAF